MSWLNSFAVVQNSQLLKPLYQMYYSANAALSVTQCKKTVTVCFYRSSVLGEGSWSPLIIPYSPASMNLFSARCIYGGQAVNAILSKVTNDTRFLGWSCHQLVGRNVFLKNLTGLLMITCPCLPAAQQVSGPQRPIAISVFFLICDLLARKHKRIWWSKNSSDKAVGPGQLELLPKGSYVPDIYHWFALWYYQEAQNGEIKNVNVRKLAKSAGWTDLTVK